METTVEIAAIDNGNFANKITYKDGTRTFRSVLGEWRERNLKQEYRQDDLEFCFNGRKGFAGTLALDESEWINSKLGDSKAHEDGKLRIMLSLSQVVNDGARVALVTGNPIRKHTPEQKQFIKDMLLGWHSIEVNGLHKTFCIERVEVAAETATSILCKPQNGRVHIVDVGAGTVGLATINDMRFIDRDSDSINVGAESGKELNIEGMAHRILNEISHKWNTEDKVFVIGGLAEKIDPFIKKEFRNSMVLYPVHNGKAISPTFASSVGYYNLGVKLWRK